MAGFGEQIRTTRFIDVPPGSTIRVEDFQNNYEPFEATVLELKEEYGPQRIPMLLVKAKHSADPVILMADGKTRVSILTSGAILAPDQRSRNTVYARRTPRKVYALQFRGGVDSATEIIQAAAGKVRIAYHQANDQTPEFLEITGIGGSTRINLGDWLIEDEENAVISTASSEVYANDYEVLA